MTPTVLNLLADSLRGRSASPEGQKPPVAIVWPDPKEEWRNLLPTLRGPVPELLALGNYDPEAGKGPAIWLRCVVEGTLPAPHAQDGGDRAMDDPPGPDQRIPILYLPGVAREDLRVGADCPDRLKPLVELMYRGTLWVQPNGRPWSPAAFLRSPNGAGLDVATDAATLKALNSALPDVSELHVANLQGRRLDADDFNRLLADDLDRDVLRWMADADQTRNRMGSNSWPAFCARCRQELELDPETDADVDAAVKLVKGTGEWGKVWNRFAEAPDIYAGVVEVLRRARPSGEIPLDRDRWPDLNAEDEEEARKALAAAVKLSPKEARAAVAELEQTHGPRREWLWARLGESPVAQVLEPLARLTEATAVAIGGATPDEIADTYANIGWQADAAAREAVAGAAHRDEAMVVQVVGHLLESWMDKTARAFQAAVEDSPLPGADGADPVEADEDECIVFVDGLRYELGRRLAEHLEDEGCAVGTTHRWAALPTVTATAKPAVAPVADQVAGTALGADFRPQIFPAPHLPDARKAATRTQSPTAARPGSGATDEGRPSDDESPPNAARPCDAARLRQAMAERDYRVLGSDVPEMPAQAAARGWMETGKIDKLGHDHCTDAVGFARAVETELDRIAQSVLGLLEVGWRSVRLVTDHGWLWLPGGLPMVRLPKHLAASKWARCAVVSGESRPADVLRFPWRWNAAQWFATPPGIACFSKRDEYAHGGVSLQECLTPDIRVERRSGPVGISASIRSIAWVRLRCVAEVEVRGGAGTADIRVGGSAGRSVVLEPKPVADDGTVSLVLDGDEHEDATLTFVVADADGRVLAHQSTRTGTPR